MKSSPATSAVLPGIGIYKICSEVDKAEAKLPIEVVPPVWGNKMSPADYFSHMRPRVEAGRGLLLPGELGCALAHIAAYNKIIASKRPSLILEDDIVLDGAFLRGLQDSLSVIGNEDFVHLAQYRHRHNVTSVGRGLGIPDTSQGFWGTAAYLVSPRMAQYLLDWHRPFVDKADNWQEIFVDCPFVPLEMPLVLHTGVASSIGDRSSPPQHPSAKHGLLLRLRRLKMRLHAPLRHRAHVRKYKATKKQVQG